MGIFFTNLTSSAKKEIGTEIFFNHTSHLFYKKNENIYLKQLSKKLFQNKFNEKLSFIVRAVSYYFLLDVVKIIKVFNDIEKFKSIKKKIIWDKDLSLLEKIILGKFKYSRNSISSFLNLPNRTRKKTYFQKAKFFFSFYSRFLKRHSNFMHNQNILTNEYLERKKINPFHLRMHLWETKNFNHNEEIQMISGQILNETFKLFKNFEVDPKIKKISMSILRDSLVSKLDYAFYVYNSINECFIANKKNDVLIGGSPSIEGVLMNYVFKKNGGTVRRFSHGGDRTFFDDFFWAESELQHCSEYYVHGQGEKKSLEKRQQIGKFDNLGHKIKFVSNGSKKHEKTFHNKTIKIKNKITFIPGSYLGFRFMHFASFKPPDLIIADYQKWIISELSNLNYDVTFKLHPKSVYFFDPKKFFCDWKCKITYNNSEFIDPKETYKPEEDNSEILIFDFAGTAFFDALASNKGIVYLNNGSRDFFDDSKAELEKRCSIVDSFLDEKNRIRFDMDEVISGLKKASNNSECSKDFFEKYFT